MDRKLARYLDLDHGFFVEAGANDGYHQSNTYWLERARGWKGPLVEPVPALCRRAARERDKSRVFNCALVELARHDEPVRLIYGGMMTTVQGTRGSEEADRAWVRVAHEVIQEKPEHEFTVPGRTLSSILDEIDPPEIDFLSLDVEGFEPQAIAGLDPERHAPRRMLVEVREGASNREAVEAGLTGWYEAIEQLSSYDLLYRRRA
jgi:FkbM family methyltransferase